ncbi:SpoIIE family protein phosphatase [Salinivirga cyanobacteriivorans]
MFSPLRNKLMFWFLIFTAISILFMGVTWFGIKQEKQYREVIDRIGEYEKTFYKDINVVNNYLLYETADTIYFSKGKSKYLDQHNIFYTKLRKGFNSLNNLENIDDFTLKKNMDGIIAFLTQYDSIIKTIAQKTYKRGFKDYGYVGDMRDKAHFLERHNKYVDQNLLLNMRRREKDYLIRYERAYIVKFREIGNRLNHSINSNTKIGLTQKEAINEALYQYMMLFDKVIQLDKEIGFHSQNGLSKELHTLTKALKAQFSLLVNKTHQRKNELSKELQGYFLIFALTLVLLSILISLRVSKHITNPLRNLSAYINDFISSDFQPDQDYTPLEDKNEIGRLSRNFYILKQEIVRNIRYFKEKVEERTAEILHQKNEIENQKEEIQSQRDILQKTNNTMEKQKQVLEVQNKNIISIIKYAQRIQSALFADTDAVKDIWHDSFVFIQPKDIVSGDFYFFDSIRPQNSPNKHVFAAIDCTGHGVPGALMSILSYNSLKQTIRELEHTNPLFVVTYMNKFIHDALHSRQRNSNLHDGLDMAYVVFEPESMKLEFIGIHMPLYIIRNEELIEYKGSKIMLGNEPEIPHTISKHTINLQKGDMVYMFSDGYADQFGGASGKKFKKKQFKQLLKAISDESIDKQKMELKETFEDWRGTIDQVDDVLVMGFRV